VIERHNTIEEKAEHSLFVLRETIQEIACRVLLGSPWLLLCNSASFKREAIHLKQNAIAARV
jgi:hypothetical protein